MPEEKSVRAPPWLSMGFPAPFLATPKQRRLIDREWKKVSKLLDKEELLAAEMMGVLEWIKLLGKKRAGDLISTIKYCDEQKRTGGRLAALADGWCNCGSRMARIATGYRCLCCGKETILVSRKTVSEVRQEDEL